MRRRVFLGIAAGSLIALPAAVRAQQSGRPVRIGLMPLGSSSSPYDQSLVDAFRQGLREAGVVEQPDVVLDVVWIGSEPDTYQVVDDLIDRGVQMLIPCGSSASAAAARQTKTIPIVFVSVGNPVGIGLVRSLSHPGRNVADT